MLNKTIVVLFIDYSLLFIIISAFIIKKIKIINKIRINNNNINSNKNYLLF